MDTERPGNSLLERTRLMSEVNGTRTTAVRTHPPVRGLQSRLSRNTRPSPRVCRMFAFSGQAHEAPSPYPSTADPSGGARRIIRGSNVLPVVPPKHRVLRRRSSVRSRPIGDPCMVAWRPDKGRSKSVKLPLANAKNTWERGRQRSALVSSRKCHTFGLALNERSPGYSSLA